MATVDHVTYDSPTEAATAAACLAKFGAAVLNVLVTNWLQGHAEEFQRQDLELLLAHAKTDPTIQIAVAGLVAQAKAVEATVNAVAAAKANVGTEAPITP